MDSTKNLRLMMLHIVSLGVSKIYGDLLAQEFGKNYGLKIGIFRAGCLTGPNHSGTDLHGFLSFLVKNCLKKKSYNIIGYKGKQVRDNLHSNDLINSFWGIYKKTKKRRGLQYWRRFKLKLFNT